MNLVYTAALVASAGGVAMIDLRFRLVFWRSFRRGCAVVLAGTAFFLLWDVVGIGLGVFRHVDSQWATGILVAPHLPLEEVLFVAFLAYLSIVLVCGWRRRQESRDRG